MIIAAEIDEVETSVGQRQAKGIPNTETHVGNPETPRVGASDLPLVGRRLRERFGRQVKRSTYGRSSTAIGLAIQADASAGYVLRDRFTRYFGVWREGDYGATAVAGVENRTGISGNKYNCLTAMIFSATAWRAVPFGAYRMFYDDGRKSGLACALFPPMTNMVE